MTSRKLESRKSVLKEIAAITADLSKTTVPFVSLNTTAEVSVRGQHSKATPLGSTATVQACRFVMDACRGIHWKRCPLLFQIAKNPSA